MEFSAAKEPSKATAAAPVYEGALVGIRNNRLVGWAWNVARPYDAIGVDFMVGQQRVGTVQADLFDQELALARKGNGFHGFSALLDTLPTGDGPFVLQAYIGGTAEPVGKPYSFRDLDEMTPLLGSRSLAGELEGLRDGAVSGWVSDLDIPESTPDLTIEYDGEPLEPLFSLDDRIVHEGRLISGWRFEAQLPYSVLDGKLHAVTAQVGQSAIKGSPLSIGPSSMNGVVQAVTALSREVAAMTRRVAVLPAVESTDGLIELLTARMLDRVDMLMAVYRDGIEQELALMRELITSGASTPGGDLRSGTQLPVLMAKTDVKRGPRVVPPIKIVFSETLPVVAGAMELVDDPYGAAYASVAERAEIELGRPARVTQTLVVQGEGATSALALLAWKFEVGGCPLLGRYEVMSGGKWRFIGQFAQMSPNMARLGRLTISSDHNYTDPTMPIAPLKLVQVEFVDGHEVQAGAEMPSSVAYHVAGKFDGRDWHNAEKGADGWYRWGGGTPQFEAAVKAGAGRHLTLIGENHVPGDPKGCAVRVNGTTELCDFRYPVAGKRRWILKTVLTDRDATRLSADVVVPPGFAKSPAEFEGSGDRRILSVSVRAIAIDGADGHAAA